MKRNPQSGLTQLELMISLAIMAVIAVLLANALNFNRQALDRSALLSNRTEMYVARETLRDRIEEMALEYAPRMASDVISGDTQSLAFETTAPSNEDDTTPTLRVQIERETGADAADLIARLTTQENGRDLGTTTLTLASNVSDLKISYYGRVSDQREKAWHDVWADDTFYPDLIKLEWNEDGGRPAPPLTWQPALIERQRFISRSSLVPPG